MVPTKLLSVVTQIITTCPQPELPSFTEAQGKIHNVLVKIDIGTNHAHLCQVADDLSWEKNTSTRDI